MPEVLKFNDLPKVLIDFHVEPFQEAYVPGARVLCREKNGENPDVFFQIPVPVAQNMDNDELEVLKKKVRDWWRSR